MAKAQLTGRTFGAVEARWRHFLAVKQRDLESAVEEIDELGEREFPDELSRQDSALAVVGSSLSNLEQLPLGEENHEHYKPPKVKDIDAFQLWDLVRKEERE